MTYGAPHIHSHSRFPQFGSLEYCGSTSPHRTSILASEHLVWDLGPINVCSKFPQKLALFGASVEQSTKSMWDRDVLLMNEILHYDIRIYPYVSYSLWGYLHMVNPRISFLRSSWGADIQSAGFSLGGISRPTHQACQALVAVATCFCMSHFENFVKICEIYMNMYVDRHLKPPRQSWCGFYFGKYSKGASHCLCHPLAPNFSKYGLALMVGLGHSC